MPAKQTPIVPPATPDGAKTKEMVSDESMHLEERLLAEAVRTHEDAQGYVIDDPQAEALARESAGDFEHRIMVRAQSLEIAPTLKSALQHLRQMFQLLLVVSLVIAVVSGATAAQVALGAKSDQPVNFFWVLGGILGVQTIALLAWLILMMVRPSGMSTGSLGGAVFALGRWLTKRLHQNPLYFAAVQAMGSVFARSAIGRWTLSLASHGLWLAFNVGCILLLVIILSTKQYAFAWETTILSDQAYVAITRGIASAPTMFGFPTPDPQQIIDSHWPDVGSFTPNAREAWSGLLIGSIVIYGLLPRILLLLFCYGMRQRASVRFRLDTALPAYARLQTRLTPVSEVIGVVDADDRPEARSFGRARTTDLLTVRKDGPAAIMGLEIDQPKSAWPPLNKGDWLNLGFVDARSDRIRALDQIKTASRPPRLIVVVCSMATTPDRGIQAFIEKLQQSTAIPVAIVLTEGQRLRARGHSDEVRQRSEDWRQLAANADVAVDRVIEVDLDHLTDASRANLAALIGSQEKIATPKRRIEQSFNLILDHVQRWRDEPDAFEQAELHRAIGRLYQDESSDAWQSLLRVQQRPGRDLTEQLKSSAERMTNLLPMRLRKNPRWLAAGAMAGVMGCVTAATLVAPVAIASLPLWAGLGAAVSAAIPAVTADQPAGAPTTAEKDLTEAVRSAALFALLLELQGRTEATITRIIDQVVDHEDTIIDSVDTARHWLSGLRERLEQALSVEAIA